MQQDLIRFVLFRCKKILVGLLQNWRHWNKFF